MNVRAPLTLLAIISLLTLATRADAVTPPYAEDFEAEATCSGSFVCIACPLSATGWTNSTADAIDWLVDAGGTPSNFTGPSIDHAPGTAAGKYLFTEASSGACQSAEAHLISPPLELAGTTNPVATFWYHMLGADMGDLHVDVLDNTQAVLQLDVIPAITDDLDEWQRTGFIDLSTWIGQTVHLRLRGITGIDFTSDMAIDDFLFFDPPTNNVALAAILNPADGTCGLSMTDVVVEVANRGFASQSNVPVQVLVSGSTTATLTGTATGPIAPLASELVTLSSFDGFAGGTYTLDASTQLPGDQVAADDTATATVTLNPTEVPTLPSVGVCPGEGATLSVNPESGVTYSWYDAASAGNQLGQGDMLTTPAISMPTTFYVEREASPESLGPVDNTFGGGGNHQNFANGLVFDVLQTALIESFYVYPNGPGDVVIRLLDSNNVVLDTTTATVNSAGTKTLVPVGFIVPPGTGYQLDAVGTTTGGLFRNNAGAMYPYNSTLINITGNIPSAAGFYYFYYDWTVKQAVCAAERTPVDATIDPAVCQVDLEMSIADDPDPVAPGGSVQLTMTVTNNGASDAPDVTVATTLPTGFASPSTTGCAEDPAGAGSCTLGIVPAGQSAQFTIDVSVDSAASGTVTTQASASTSGVETNPADNSASEDTTIDDGATTSNGAGGASSGQGSGTGTGGGGGGDGTLPAETIDGGCGCEVVGQSRRDRSLFALLGLLALGIAVRRSRGRRSARSHRRPHGR